MLATQKAVSADLPILEVKYVEFNMDNIDEYRREFEKFQNNCVIEGGWTFDSKRWGIKTGIKYKKANFDISEIEYKRILKGGIIQFEREEFCVALRAYALILLRRVVNETVQMTMNELRALLKESMGFSPSFGSDVGNSEVFKSRASGFIRILDFFNFVGIEIGEQYIDAMEAMVEKGWIERNQRSTQRKLSTFYEAFKMDEYMQQAIAQLDDNEFECFFPTVLWWKLSTIIPMRPSEIIATLKDCLVCKNGEYRMTLSRSKLKGNKVKKNFDHHFKSCYRLHEIRINVELARLIQRYNAIVDTFDGDRQFLISKKSLVKYCPQMISSTTVSEHNKKNVTYRNLVTNTWGFYKYILSGKYGLTIIENLENEATNEGEVQMFNVMDTRHFAIVNMILMGYEPMTVKEVAGHADVNSSYHYYSHVEEFTKCYIISMAKRKVMKNEVTGKNTVLNMDYSTIQRNFTNNHSHKLSMLTKDYKVVDEGYCVYKKDDYSPCIAVDGRHNKCPHFIPDKKNVDNFLQELDMIDQDITVETEALKDLVKNHKEVVDFSNKYMSIINTIRNKANNKAEILAGYMFSPTSEL